MPGSGFVEKVGEVDQDAGVEGHILVVQGVGLGAEVAGEGDAVEGGVQGVLLDLCGEVVDLLVEVFDLELQILKRWSRRQDGGRGHHQDGQHQGEQFAHLLPP